MQRAVRCWATQPRPLSPPTSPGQRLTWPPPDLDGVPHHREGPAPEWPLGHKSKCTWTQGKGRPEGPGEEPCPLWATRSALLRKLPAGARLGRPTERLQWPVPAPGARDSCRDLPSGSWATGAVALGRRVTLVRLAKAVSLPERRARRECMAGRVRWLLVRNLILWGHQGAHCRVTGTPWIRFGAGRNRVEQACQALGPRAAGLVYLAGASLCV